MSEGQVYNSIGLLEEAQRYRTSIGFLELLYDELKGSKRLLHNGLGARLLTTSSALTNELYGIDINQGSIQRAEEFISSWDKYRDKEPFKTEFEFLKTKKLHPKFGKHYFYLKENFPEFREYFNGEIASELFLHLNKTEILEILNNANRRLRQKGKFVFTLYPSGNKESLDKKFCELSSKICLKKSEFISNGCVDIGLLAQQLQDKDPGLYNENKEKYWLDLSRVRVFPPKDIERCCEESGFEIKNISYPRGGMFSFAERSAYTLIK